MSRHRWRAARVLVLTLTAAALPYAAAKANAPRRPRVAEVLRARSFDVVGRDGRVAAWLRVEPKGFPWLAVTDRTGRSRATLHLSQDRYPRLAVMDRAGDTRGELGMTRDGASVFNLASGSRNWRVGLGAEGTGSGLDMVDGSDIDRALLSLEADGSLMVIVSTPGNRSAASFYVNAKGAPYLGLTRDHKPVWDAP